MIFGSADTYRVPADVQLEAEVNAILSGRARVVLHRDRTIDGRVLYCASASHAASRWVLDSQAPFAPPQLMAEAILKWVDDMRRRRMEHKWVDDPVEADHLTWEV